MKKYILQECILQEWKNARKERLKGWLCYSHILIANANYNRPIFSAYSLYKKFDSCSDVVFTLWQKNYLVISTWTLQHETYADADADDDNAELLLGRQTL